MSKEEDRKQRNRREQKIAREIQSKIPNCSYTKALRLLREFNDTYGVHSHDIPVKINMIVQRETSNGAGDGDRLV